MFGLLIVSCYVLVSALGLRLQDAEEGNCRGVRYKALPHVDLDFVDSLNYIPSLNRYQLYRHASSDPHFHEMREFELYYKSCLTQNTSYVVGDGTAFGFGGRRLGSYTARPRRDQQTIIDTTPILGRYDLNKHTDRMQQHITLTDHRTFAFLANCWLGSDERSFEVYASSPDLSASVKRTIEEHAVSLGFKRDQIVFLSYDSCGGDTFGEQGGVEGGGSFGVGPGWSQDLGLGRDTVHIPKIEVPRSGKIITSRATINPILGNNNLRRGSGALGVPGRLSLANSGWSR